MDYKKAGIFYVARGTEWPCYGSAEACPIQFLI